MAATPGDASREAADAGGREAPRRRVSVRAGTIHHLPVRGVALAVEAQGEGAAILLVHGFPLDRTMWRPLVPLLTGWRRIAPDLRGFGLSEVGDGRIDVATYADDLVVLLDALELDTAIVCGLSLGGYVAFDLVRRHADRVRGLILLNTRAEADTPEALAKRDEMIALVERGGPGALLDELLPKLLAPSSLEAMPHVVDHVRTMITGSPARGLIGAIEAMKARPDSSAMLGGLEVPTLVVAGQEDRLISVAHARRMADRIPGAQFTVIPDAGHLIPLEQPVAAGRVIAEFLQLLA